MSKPKRRTPNKTEKLAAALLLMKRADENGKLVPLVPDEVRAKAKSMPSMKAAKYILEQVEWDHYPKPVWAGGDNHPDNLQPLPPKVHRKKSAKIDKPMSAKSKRLSEAQEEFRQKLLSKVGQGGPRSSRVEKSKKKAVMPGTKASGLKKKVNGKVEKRDR